MTTPVGALTLPPATLPTTDATGSAGSAAGSGASTGQTLLDPQAFLRLLVAQLQYQDPSNPVDTSSFLNQSAMLSQVQSMTSMTATLTDMATAQQTQAATTMIGRQVSFLDPDGVASSGTVSAVSLRSGVAMLHVGDLAVPLSGVLEVSDPAVPG